MMLRKVFPVLIAGLALILAACAPAGTEPELPETGETEPAAEETLVVTIPPPGVEQTPVIDVTPEGTEPPGTGQELPPVAADLAQRQLAEQLGVPLEDITIESFERVEWPDACLGVPQEGEACAQVVTPGWLIILTVNGQQYEVHTDELGQAARIADENLQLEMQTPTP